MKSEEINSLFKNLSRVIKDPKSDLKYKNKFTLLVSVVLSAQCTDCLLYTSPSPRDQRGSRMPSSA